MIIDVKWDDPIPANDRVAQYGDGCFTTMCVSDGKIELFNNHLQRLQHSCQRLHIEFADWDKLQRHLKERAKNIHHGVLKAIISRGTGGRGYSTSGVTEARCYVSQNDMPSHYPMQRKQGICLAMSEIKLAAQPQLAGIKHCNRLEQVLIKIALDKTHYDDVIVCDYQGHVIESSIGNLFWRKENTWMTPLLNNCGVSGVMRNHILTLMKSNNINVLESNFAIDDLIGCDAMFVCNSLMKLVPVKEIMIQQQRQLLNIEFVSSLVWLTDNLHEVSECE
ncbi:aminodeoxychorismate lyase [Aliiglaciecola litoralis]|uniref:Aminodeoxychorismate lyase n=1 Tax=Aliiglaciecola litoralis TaxID=582857 RepID=A0ABN1LC63_9ALTE